MHVSIPQRSTTAPSYDGLGLVLRIAEVAVCLIALVLMAPAFVLVALAIIFSTPGGAILAQERVGRFGITFRCYKFRTMYRDAPVGPSHTVGPEHCTVIGKILRKTRFDELPQLLNVLNGTMRLVGPRPCLPSQTELVQQRLQNGILDVHPGITGWAQTNAIDMSCAETLVAADRTYIENRSGLFDLKIMIRTVAMTVGRER